MQKFIANDVIYDEETYPNIFTVTFIDSDGSNLITFECSSRKNQSNELLAYLRNAVKNKKRFVGFNNIGFDYPVLHEMLNEAVAYRITRREYVITPEKMYSLAQKQIESFKGEFGHTIKSSECFIPQLDLFKIHHFDNKAKSTSLKMLEFNMRSDNIEDLPYPVGTYLKDHEMDVLITYNQHDVKETLKFYQKSIPMIDFRDSLSKKYNRDFTNHNDTKIGKDYFIMRLEEEGIACYTFKGGARKINQTKRPVIKLKDCLFDYYDFSIPAFKAVQQWFAAQEITETKGVFTDIEEHELGPVREYAELISKRKKLFKAPTEEQIAEFKKQRPLSWIEVEELQATENLFDADGNQVYETVINEKGKEKKLKVKVPKKSYWWNWRVADCLNVVVNGFRFDFGVGGIHGSLINARVQEDTDNQVIDADVSSMYPNIAISNKIYPEHLTAKFCDIYKDMYEQRKSYPKGSAENAMLKLALNGTYGDSNNKYSPFYDPQFTMSITLNGQLSLCLLADKLMKIAGLQIVQVNTDGITVKLPRDQKALYDRICSDWQKQVKLDLEFADYSTMLIRDVNNYIAVYTNGKVKRKGAYQYEDLGFHQNQGGLVIPMAAEFELLGKGTVEEFICQHDNKWDFLLRTKVPRSSKLFLVDEDGREIQQQNICRYYVSTSGGNLVKVMPPLACKEDQGDRRFGIEVGYKVLTCNKVPSKLQDIDFEYYIQQANKLLLRGDLTTEDEDELS